MNPPTTASQIAQPIEGIVADFTKRLGKLTATPEQAAVIEARAAKDAEQRNRSQIEELRRAWNAPKRHVACKLGGNTEWNLQFIKLKEMLDPCTGKLVALVGVRGNGKTQLAVELMRGRTAALKTALFCSAIEFFIKIKSTYRKESDMDEMAVLKEFQKPSLLVIDEIGKRGSSDWENTMLFELLNRRYNDMVDTILIDNRTKNEFTETIGPSLASRMNEGGGIVECGWPSFRV